MPDTCRYVITLSAAKSRDVVIFTRVHWTAKQRQIALGSILLPLCRTGNRLILYRSGQTPPVVG
jgi:hypothetical protein